jgi:hypothetical protein
MHTHTTITGYLVSPTSTRRKSFYYSVRSGRDSRDVRDLTLHVIENMGFADDCLVADGEVEVTICTRLEEQWIGAARDVLTYRAVPTRSRTRKLSSFPSARCLAVRRAT